MPNDSDTSPRAVDARCETPPLPPYVDEQAVAAELKDEGVRRLESRYLSRDSAGTLCETPAERFYKVARTVAEVEERRYGAAPATVGELTEQFYAMLASLEFLPAGRILCNVASSVSSLFNCYVLPVPDDLAGIYEQVRNAAIIHKNGGGTGYNFSALRPRGMYVNKSQGIASGPVSFIGQFDKETEIINSGNRRGANMGVLNVTHPDIFDFIHAKTTEGKLANFNVSVGVPDAFLQAVLRKGFYTLEYPRGTPFAAGTLQSICTTIDGNMGGAEVGQSPRPPSLRIRGADVVDTYANQRVGRVNDEGCVQLDAAVIFTRLCRLARETGDPGVVFLDTINRSNPLPENGPIDATNPCGEQPLHPYDACNLGSVNLARHICSEEGSAGVDWDKLERTVTLATRLLDNCNDLNRGPIPEIEETVKANRRIGLGVMGWADLLGLLAVPYDSDEALELAERVMRTIAETSRRVSCDLAEAKGPCPALTQRNAGPSGEPVPRNLQVTTVAPTGSISMIAGCNSGIEPYFAVLYRKHLRGGETVDMAAGPLRKALADQGVELDSVRDAIRDNNGSLRGLECIPEVVRRAFPTAHDIAPDWHVRMQAAFQKGTDNAVSKTVNLPEQATAEDVGEIYLLSWELGCKGVTVYREGSRGIQVLDRRGPKPPPIHYRQTEKGSAAEGRMVPLNKRAEGDQFRCPQCGLTEYHIEAGCPDPVCNSCGWSRGTCG